MKFKILNRAAHCSRIAFCVLGMILVTACSEQVEVTKTYPMLGAGHSLTQGNVWQIYTYGNEKVMHERVLLVDGKYVRISRQVYVNHQSQFVYKDGNPIKGPNGRELYWSSQGHIVARVSSLSKTKLERVYEDQVFAVNGQPIARNTGLLIHDLYKKALADWRESRNQLEQER